MGGPTGMAGGAGGSPAPPRELASGRYRVVRLIAHAAMTDVYEVVHAELGKRCIAKVLRRPFSVDPRLSKALHNEGRALASMRHPSLVEVVDYGLDPAGPFLVLEYLEGETLAALLKREGKLPRERALPLMMGAIEALMLVHKAGLVHRNISPEALYVTRDADTRERLKLLDFGFARHVDAEQVTHTEVNPLALSIPYLALEQLTDSATADARADVYAAGAVLFAMLTGKPPHADVQLQERLVKGEDLAVPALGGDVPERIATALRKALATRARDRVADATALHALLDPEHASEEEATWVEAAPGAITQPRGVVKYASQNSLQVLSSSPGQRASVISSAPAPFDSAPTIVKGVIDDSAPTTVQEVFDDNAPTTIKKVADAPATGTPRTDRTAEVEVLAAVAKPAAAPPRPRRKGWLAGLALVVVVVVVTLVVRARRPATPATPATLDPPVATPARALPTAEQTPPVTGADKTTTADTPPTPITPTLDASEGSRATPDLLAPPPLVEREPPPTPSPARVAAPKPPRPPALKPARVARPAAPRPADRRVAPPRKAAAKTEGSGKESGALFGGDDL